MKITVYLKDDDGNAAGQMVADATRVVDDGCEMCGSSGDSYRFRNVQSGMANTFDLPCLVDDEDGVEKIVIQ